MGYEPRRKPTTLISVEIILILSMYGYSNFISYLFSYRLFFSV